MSKETHLQARPYPPVLAHNRRSLPSGYARHHVVQTTNRKPNIQANRIPSKPSFRHISPPPETHPHTLTSTITFPSQATTLPGTNHATLHLPLPPTRLPTSTPLSRPHTPHPLHACNSSTCLRPRKLRHQTRDMYTRMLAPRDQNVSGGLALQETPCMFFLFIIVRPFPLPSRGNIKHLGEHGSAAADIQGQMTDKVCGRIAGRAVETKRAEL
ncbi:hypothetical protein IQ07DRAFT_258367 [Pyrenochaeta sp. DS3sAY3a]|nr:hypothetical protein IQ07DRAFT_258367 [Pyrenochaeta sp. DS3sAY3a]